MAGMDAKAPEGKQHARWGEKACVRKVASEVPSIVGNACHFSIEDEGGLTAAYSSVCKGLNALREIGIWRGMEDEALETSTASRLTIASLSSPQTHAGLNYPDERFPHSRRSYINAQWKEELRCPTRTVGLADVVCTQPPPYLTLPQFLTLHLLAAFLRFCGISDVHLHVG